MKMLNGSLTLIFCVEKKKYDKRQVLSKETTPLAGVVLSLYADIYGQNGLCARLNIANHFKDKALQNTYSSLR